MTSKLSRTPESAAITIAPELVESARRYAKSAKAAATRRAYEGDWQRFHEWALSHRAVPLPADPRVVAVYLAARAEAGRSVATIVRDLAAIAFVHTVAGHPSPRPAAAVREVVAGIRRETGVAQKRSPPDPRGRSAAHAQAAR